MCRPFQVAGVCSVHESWVGWRGEGQRDWARGPLIPGSRARASRRRAAPPSDAGVTGWRSVLALGCRGLVRWRWGGAGVGHLGGR